MKELWTSLLFPRRCPVCGEITEPEGALICGDCLGRCLRCGPPSANGAARRSCQNRPNSAGTVCATPQLRLWRRPS